ncbi:poly-beta-1,6-N-acetyl-D-glucosamine biosynthesis protein PgaD [Alcaligenes sp. WGS1538]|uniref:poly-beta-1,6-N-acetyl-D-glucosamine biosynthesis protein PgaD n=1 Tax=Alcaligenes sp. WGS1538 TaxID=3366811 RepID=UPI00372D7063
MIITTQRHPVNRWIDRLLTLAGWLAFSYLVAQGLLLLINHSMNKAGFEQIDPIFPTLTTFLFYGAVLLANGLLLLAWSRWRQRQRQERHLRQALYRQRSRAAHIGQGPLTRFDHKHIDAVRQSRVVVLYHSQDGAVQHVEPTGPATVRQATGTDDAQALAPLIFHPRAYSERPTPNQRDWG